MGPRARPSNLPSERRRHIGAVLLDLQLRLDADVFEVALGQLRGIDEVGGPGQRGNMSWVLKPLGMPASASRRLASLGSY